MKKPPDVRGRVGSGPEDLHSLKLQGFQHLPDVALANRHADAGKAADLGHRCLASVADGGELHFGGAEAFADRLDVHEQSRLRGRSMVVEPLGSGPHTVRHPLRRGRSTQGQFTHSHKKGASRPHVSLPLQVVFQVTAGIEQFTQRSR